VQAINTTPNINNFNAHFFDRYYLKGWDSTTDVKSEARAKALPEGNWAKQHVIPDFLRFAVPMKQQAMERKMDVVQQDGYARASYASRR
jgi:hypothetical protein